MKVVLRAALKSIAPTCIGEVGALLKYYCYSVLFLLLLLLYIFNIITIIIIIIIILEENRDDCFVFSWCDKKYRTWHFFKQSKVQWTAVASLKGHVTRDDRQHNDAMLEQRCNHSKQYRNNVATLCCAKNRRCESFRNITLMSTAKY